MNPDDIRVHLADDDLLVFVHIPKTAGTSVRHILRAYRPSSLEEEPMSSGEGNLRVRYRPAGTEPLAAGDVALATIAPEQLIGQRLLYGHYTYSFLVGFLPCPAIYITFLRDPVKRALSNYAHLQMHGKKGGHVWGPDTDLEAFVYHPLAADSILQNLQTRMLGTKLTFDGVAGGIAALAQERRAASIGKAARAEAAIATLDTMPFVGLTERMDESLSLLAYTFGWEPLASAPSLNVAPPWPARDVLPQHIRDRLVELNQEDITLYRYAEQLFERRLARMRAMSKG